MTDRCRNCFHDLTRVQNTDSKGHTYIDRWVCCKCGARYPVKTETKA